MRKYLFILFLFITTLSYGQTYYNMGNPIWQRTPTSKGWFLRIDAGTFGKYNFYTAPQLDSLLAIGGTLYKLKSDSTAIPGGYVTHGFLNNIRIYFNGMSGDGSPGNPLTPITTSSITLNSTVPVQSGAVYNALLNYPTISVANATYAPIGINGTVTNVSSSTGAITITNPATTPVFTFNQAYPFNFTGAVTLGNSWTFNNDNAYSFGNATNVAAAYFGRALTSNSAITLTTLNSNSILFKIGATEQARINGADGALLVHTTTTNGVDAIQTPGTVNFATPSYSTTGTQGINQAYFFNNFSTVGDAKYLKVSGGNTYTGNQFLTSGLFGVASGLPFALENPASTAFTGIYNDGLSNGNHHQILVSADDTIAGKSQIRKLDTILTTRFVPYAGSQQLHNINLGTISSYDIVNNRLGVGTQSPTGRFQLVQSTDVPAGGILITTADGLNTGAIYRGTASTGALILRNGGVDVASIQNASLGLLTALPTHTLTLGSTSTGIAYYNTTDQLTNYERVREFWSSNIYSILAEKGGTGTLRNININGNVSITPTGVVNSGSLTASTALVSDASKNIISSVTTATQVGYLSTTTGDIQTQLNSKGAGTVTSITPGVLFTSSTPITTSGTLNIDSAAISAKYVKLTTGQTIGGVKNWLNTQTIVGASLNVQIYGGNGGFGFFDGGVGLKNSTTSFSNSGFVTIFDLNNTFSFTNSLSSLTASFDLTNLTNSRIYKWPDAPGTVALINQLPIHGNSTTTGVATTVVTVTIGSTMANTTYNTTITPRDLLTAVNYYISAQTTTTFDVTFLTALTGSINFDYCVIP